MRIERMVSNLVLAGALAGLLVACGSSDGTHADYSEAALHLRINELQASNQTTPVDEQGEADDWIELYNSGSTALDLEGYYVSDSKNNPTKHQLPKGVTVPPEGFVLLWADGTPDQGAAHLSYKLSASGESVLITNPNGDPVDSVDYGVAVAPNSYARFPDGTGAFTWCIVATPAALNGASCGAAP